MPDTRLLQGKNDEGGTLAAILTAGALSATLNIAPSKAPGVLVLEAGTVREERIYYATKDDTAKTVSGLVRDYSNVNGGVGFEHQASTPWETMQDIEYINNIVDALREGFISEFNVATYVSASSFTVVGDQTSIYTAGRQTRYNQDNTKIGIVASSSYNSGTGLTTVLTNYGTVPNPITTLEYGIQPKTATTLVATGSGAQNLAYNYAADTGAANAYAVALTPVPTVYTEGMHVVFKATHANTGASTLAVNGMAAKNLLLNDVPLPTNYIRTGQIVSTIYDGTSFQVQSITRDKGWVDLTDGATITIDLRLGDKFRLVGANALGGNRTLAITTDGTNKPWILVAQQDDTGSRLLTWFSGDSTFATTDVVAATDIITVGRDIPTGTPIIFSSTTTVPAGLVAGTTYYAIRQSATTIKVASSLANAQAGTAIDITDQGTGTHTIKCQVRWGGGGTAPTLTTGKRRLDTFGFIDLLVGVYMGYIVAQDE